MPFKSIAQQHYLFAKKPKIAQEFANNTPQSLYPKLPKKVTPKVPNSLSTYAKMLGGK